MHLKQNLKYLKMFYPVQNYSVDVRAAKGIT